MRECVCVWQKEKFDFHAVSFFVSYQITFFALTKNKNYPWSLQRDADFAVETAATLDRGRKEGRWLHRIASRSTQQSRRGQSFCFRHEFTDRTKHVTGELHCCALHLPIV